MKRFMVFTVLLVFAATIPSPFAEGGGRHGADRRTRKAVRVWNKKAAEEWKKFEAELARTEAELEELEKALSRGKRKSPSPKK